MSLVKIRNNTGPKIELWWTTPTCTFRHSDASHLKPLFEACSLRLMQQNYISELERLLENANEKSAYQECIEFLLIEVYKYSSGLSPDIKDTILKLRQNTYNLRNVHTFESQNPKTKKFGPHSIAYRASQLWEKVSK